MLDLFTIFSKGGIVLWCFQGTTQSFTASVNALIKSVVLQERGGLGSFTHEALTLKYKLDNEFELVFVVAYQNFLKLSYVDKLLSDIQLEFRNRYKDDLSRGKLCRNLDGFTEFFHEKLSEQVEASKNITRSMRSFEESVKSKKTVASMIERKEDDVNKKKKKNLAEKTVQFEENHVPCSLDQKVKSNGILKSNEPTNDDSMIQENLRKLQEKFNKKTVKTEPIKTVEIPSKKTKQKREWDFGGTTKDLPSLDFSNQSQISEQIPGNMEKYVSMRGQLKNIEDISEDSDDDNEIETKQSGKVTNGTTTSNTTSSTKSNKGSFGFLSSLKNFVGSKVLTRTDIEPIIEKMKIHLISKNVAAEIAINICESISSKLEGKVLGTFKSVTSTVKQTLEESCVQLLTPHRRIDILRDAMDAKQKKTPYVVVFCGVNGVGKSTNLAKICYWLMENDLRVLIAACDTFRAGAVEQLRTHCRKLIAIHPPEAHNGQTMVQLYEKGYGKDAAGVAMEAIYHAKDHSFDVVLVDTAGRMQGNEPLMKSLAKLIKVNLPDLVLFVGEALVGNDAVDQLVKFNQALADFSSMENPHLIDGIVLTKFDTIDDKVGAAVSMTYITGQPIVFVGTGQTYSDLKNLNAKSVVNALMKS